MISIKRFSRLQDSDFISDLHRRKRDATDERKAAKWLGGAVGAALGGVAGSGIGSPHNKGRNGLIGAAVGGLGMGALSHIIARAEEDRVHQRANSFEKRYKSASEKDKEYLRHRYHRLEDREHEDAQHSRTRQAIWLSSMR